MYEYGTTLEQLADVAVAARRWAQLNPKAFVRDPLSVSDVMASRVLASPLRALDCCLVTDGGGRRRDERSARPVVAAGTGVCIRRGGSALAQGDLADAQSDDYGHRPIPLGGPSRWRTSLRTT